MEIGSTIQQHFLLQLEAISLMKPVKHVTVKVRFIQECVQRKIVSISYVTARKNISDMMTKQSVGPQFISHRDFTLGYVDSFPGVDTFAGTALFRRSRRVRGIRV